MKFQSWKLESVLPSTLQSLEPSPFTEGAGFSRSCSIEFSCSKQKSTFTAWQVLWRPVHTYVAVVNFRITRVQFVVGSITLFCPIMLMQFQALSNIFCLINFAREWHSWSLCIYFFHQVLKSTFLLSGQPGPGRVICGVGGRPISEDFLGSLCPWESVVPSTSAYPLCQCVFCSFDESLQYLGFSSAAIYEQPFCSEKQLVLDPVVTCLLFFSWQNLIFVRNTFYWTKHFVFSFEQSKFSSWKTTEEKEKQNTLARVSRTLCCHGGKLNSEGQTPLPAMEWKSKTLENPKQIRLRWHRFKNS